MELSGQAKHDKHLEAILKHMQSTGIALNKEIRGASSGRKPSSFLATSSTHKEFHQIPENSRH